MPKKPRYPICPRCGGPVVAAMMTSRSFTKNIKRLSGAEKEIYYHPDALSVYCCNADCNYDVKLAEIPYPPPGMEERRSAPEFPFADWGKPYAREVLEAARTECIRQEVGQTPKQGVEHVRRRILIEKLQRYLERMEI